MHQFLVLNLAHKIICVDNSNGVGITSMLTGPAIATCTLETPVLGFDIRPFNVGDKIFVRTQQAVDGVGDGYNSKIMIIDSLKLQILLIQVQQLWNLV